MSKETMLGLMRSSSIPNPANRIVLDYERAGEEWGREFSLIQKAKQICNTI